MDTSDISAYIIAGGKSTRFGEDKALYLYRGKPLIEHVIERIAPLFGKIAIVADDSDRFSYLGFPCHGDIIPGLGPLGGLYTALMRTDTDGVFVFACDMPECNRGLIRYMISESAGYDATIPIKHGYHERLHAIYRRSCIGAIEKRINSGQRQFSSFFEDVTVREIRDEEIWKFGDPDIVFRNINYRRDAEIPITRRWHMHAHSKYLESRAAKALDNGMITAEMLDFYKALYAVSDAQHERYINAAAMPVLSLEDLPLSENGAHLFTDGAAGSLLLPGLAPLIEATTAHHPGLSLESLRLALSGGAASGEAIAAVLKKDSERIATLAADCKIGADETIFILSNWMKPFLAALRERSGLPINETETETLCPFCGYYPDMAAIVSGKDGKRFLHCSLCGHRWPFRRIMCAVCGTENADSLENLTPEGDTRNRIDVCSSCNGYIKTLRFDSIDALDECDLEVENILTAGLDSAALKKGFRRP